MSYELADNERQGLVQWYSRGVNSDHRSEPGRLEAFMHQVRRLHTGLLEHGLLDETEKPKRADHGRVGNKGRRQRRTQARKPPKRMGRVYLQTPFSEIEKVVRSGGGGNADLAYRAMCTPTAIGRVKFLVEYAPPQVLEELRAGKITVTTACKELRITIGPIGKPTGPRLKASFVEIERIAAGGGTLKDQARKARCGRCTVARARFLLKSAPTSLLAKLRAGEIALTTEYFKLTGKSTTHTRMGYHNAIIKPAIAKPAHGSAIHSRTHRYRSAVPAGYGSCTGTMDHAT